MHQSTGISDTITYKTFLKTKVGFVAFTVSDLEMDRVYFHSPGARKGHLFERNIYNSNLVLIRHMNIPLESTLLRLAEAY